MTVEYLDLADYVGIAAEVTGLDEAVIAKIADMVLAKNHPLPDGNKRVAEVAVLAIAAGDWDEARVAAWLRPRVTTDR